jgi:hypothetical protein
MIQSPPPQMPAMTIANWTTSGGAHGKASAAEVAASAPISSAPSPPMITMPSCAGSAVHSAVRISGAARASVFCQENQVPNAP